MNLNRLYKIFGSRPPLSREEIADYGNSTDAKAKHSVEMKEASDPFEADAIEGWESLDYNMSAMSNLDKRFLKGSNLGWYLMGTAIVAAFAVGFLLLNSDHSTINNNTSKEKEKLTTLLEDQQVTIDQSDVAIPDSINKLIDAPKEQQVQIKKIQKEFKDMEDNYIDNIRPKVEMLPLDINIQPNAAVPELIRIRKRGKEVYLREFKLIDYRSYRSKPTVKTSQFVLTGTPANMEGEESETYNSEMKEVEIAYIEYLEKSMERFSRGNYKNALTRFDVIINTYADDVNANFYSGLCLYNLGQYEAAIDRFMVCTNSSYSNFDEEAQWMTALSYEKIGNQTKALSYFQKIIDQGGYYKKQALAKMK